MLQVVLATDPRSGLKLSAIGPTSRLSELAFTLPANKVQVAKLNRLLEDRGYAVGRLNFRTVSGYLNGAIDLVFRHSGCYFLLDWKWNYLGNTARDYRRDRLERAMTQLAYRLQYRSTQSRCTAISGCAWPIMTTIGILAGCTTCSYVACGRHGAIPTDPPACISAAPDGRGVEQPRWLDRR